MGMSAEVVAIGPFHRELLPLLRGADLRHANTRDGAVFVERVFATPGTTRSRALASCFGVAPWEFGTHALDPGRADIAALHLLFDPDRQAGTNRDPVDAFIALRAAGFRFFFLPNG